MSYLRFEISYADGSTPAWEALRTLRGITLIYYYSLVVRNERYTRKFNEMFQMYGELILDDLPKQLQIERKDQLFLEVNTQNQILVATVSNNNDQEAIHASDAMEAIKKLREKLRQEREAKGETAAINITESIKRQRLEGDQEIQQNFLRYIQESQLDGELKRIIQNAAILACLSLLTDGIERVEFTLVGISR